MGQLFGASEAMPVAANYPSHPITERFNVMTVYPLARSVTPVSGGVNGRTAQPIVETSERSWAEANLKAIFGQQPTKMDPAEGDKAGPVTIAAAVSRRGGRRRRPIPTKPEPGRARSRKRASWCSATPISRPMAIWGSRATATSS